MLDSNQIQNIVRDAIDLYETYNESELLDLLNGEQKRIQKQQGIILGGPPIQEIITNIMLLLGDQLRGHSEFTTASVTLITTKAIDYLAKHNLIKKKNVLMYQFMIAILTALLMTAIYKTWDAYR
jgi:uncharacterized protein YjgD (DUF1641 family)